MPLQDFIALVRSNPENIEFEQTMDVIARYYHYTPTAFSNGIGDDVVTNAAGSNEGSCKIFAFAKLNALTEEETLACFGRFYREDVLNHPEANDHGNIRTFMRHGWIGIQFNGQALSEISD